jgi:transposase
MAAKKAKKTYTQKWREYNAAQTNEKFKFLRLLHELCQGVIEPAQCLGRPRQRLSDILFCMALKVYTKFPTRRSIPDLKLAFDNGFISRVPGYNTISTYSAKRKLTRYLEQLITESSLPLRIVETDFALDSSGFSTSNFGRYVDLRFGKADVIDRRKWVKVHLMCGVTTHIVTAAQVSKPSAGDSPYFKPLVQATNQNFDIREVSADKAYSSLANLRIVADKQATPYIPFKINAKAEHRSKDPLWTRMYHFYAYNEEWFKRHYHKRSNVETTFSMIKEKFGTRLMSKKEVAQVNEVLCKVLCHNICVVIQSMYELGIEPVFWGDQKKAS